MSAEAKRTRADVLRQGAAHHQQGRLTAARACYEQVLERDPNCADALHLLGGVEKAEGRVERAIALIQRAIAVNDRAPLFWSNLAAAWLDASRPDDALAAAERALALAPDFAEAHRHAAIACHRLHQSERAEAAARAALKLQPRDPQAWNALGAILRRAGKEAAALEAYGRALALRPAFPEALNNLGATLLAQGRAAEAETALEQAARLAPNSPETLNNMGKARQLQGKANEAVRDYGAALTLRPDNPLWRIRQALVCPVIPASAKAIGYWRRRFLDRLPELPRVDLARRVNELPFSHAAPPYHLAYQGEDNLALKSRFADLFDNSFPPPASIDPEQRPTRICFLVTSGHEGIFLKCTRGVLNRWGNTDATLTVMAPPGALKRIRGQVDNPGVAWLAMPNDMAVAIETVRCQNFHLIYYWEVGSDALNYFLPFFRLAPVQCTSWGTSETSGAPHVDWYLSCSAWEDESAQARYRERLKLLSRPPIFYEPPRRETSPRKNMSDFGLPAGARAYVCVQNLFKLHPDFDALAARLLDHDPNGVAVLVEGKQAYWTELLRARLARVLDPGRVHFLPRLDYADYLDLLTAADVLLDSPHFSGGNTSYEALSLGAPVVALPGRLAHGRFTLGCYRRLDVLDCVVEDEDGYVSLATELANDPPRRAAIRERLLTARAKLVEDAEAVVEFERALVDLARRGPGP